MASFKECPAYIGHGADAFNGAVAEATRQNGTPLRRRLLRSRKHAPKQRGALPPLRSADGRFNPDS
jgi:hypothetical protein